MTAFAIADRNKKLIAAAALLACVGGCRSANLRAKDLPSELRSASDSNRSKLDFARIASPGTSDSILARGDLLEVTVATTQNAEDPKPAVLRVADDGMVDVPIVGQVPVAGLEEFEASQNIANLSIQRGIYLRPIVTVEIKSKAVNRVTVLGAVNEPGVHELPRGSSDLISALAAAGGLTEEAGTQVEIVRQPKFSPADNSYHTVQAETGNSGIELVAGQEIADSGTPQSSRTGWSSAQTLKIDMASTQALQDAGYPLSDRDVIRIPLRQKEMIYVTGLVSDPDQFELKEGQDVHLLDAIALAGGLSSPIANKVLIIRRVDNRPQPVVIEASISTAKQDGKENLRLQAGDTISVEQTPATAVVDSISKFFRLTFGVASTAF